MDETKIISSSEKAENISAPVVTEWHKFIFNGENANKLPIHAGVGTTGEIWLNFSNIRGIISIESCGTLNKDEFNKLASNLPKTMCRKIWHYSLALQDYRSIVAIAPNGLYEVTLALLRSDQPELAKKAIRKIWNWLVHNVFPEMHELAARNQAEILPHEDLPDEISSKKISHENLPDEVPEAVTRPPFMIKQRSFTFADKYEIRAGIDINDEIWLASRDVFDALLAESGGAIYYALWTPVLAKLSGKQCKEIMLRKDDQIKYDRVGALNISGVYAVTNALKDKAGEPGKAAADKLWHWVMGEVIFPMLKFANNNKPEPEEQEPEEPDLKTQKAEAVLRKIEQQQRQKQAPQNPRRESVTLLEFTDILKFNGIDIPLDALLHYFRQCEWIDKDPRILPTSFALNSGLFTITTKRFPDGSMTRRTELTVKGQWYFLRMFAMLKSEAVNCICDELLPERHIDINDADRRLKRRGRKAADRRWDAGIDIIARLMHCLLSD